MNHGLYFFLDISPACVYRFLIYHNTFCMFPLHKYSIKDLFLFLLTIASLFVFFIKLWSYFTLCMQDGMGTREMAEVMAIRNIQTGVFQSADYFPDNIYLYGILKPAILSLIPFGSHTIFANRFLSVVCLLAACGVMRQSICTLLQILGRRLNHAVIFFLLVIYFSSFNAYIDRSDALGFMLSNLIIYLSLKNFKFNVVLYPILLACCYMTKQYYLHTLLYILTGYIILHPKKHRLIEPCIVCLLSAIILALLFLLPQTRYALQHHLNMSGEAQLKYMIRGWFVYSWHIFPIFILFIPSLFTLIHKTWDKSIKKTTLRNTLSKATKNRVLFYLTLNLLLHSIIMLRLAQHTGAQQPQYFTQIYAPIVFLCVAYVLANHTPRLHDIATATFFLFIYTFKEPIRFTLPQKINTSEYQTIVREFSENREKIRGCASTAWIELKCKGKVDDNGQLFYLPTISSTKGNFGLREFNQKALEYQTELTKKIQNQEYDVIYLDDKEHDFSLISRKNILDILEKYYKQEKAIRITPSMDPIFRYIPQ